jgi:hypothetical protein
MTHLALSTVIAIAVMLPAISAQNSGPMGVPESRPARALAPCLNFPSDTRDMAVVSSFAPERAYVDLPVEEIKKMVPFLNPTTLYETHPGSDTGTATQSTDKTKYILSKTGEMITDLLHRTPNLLADEKVVLTDQSLNSGLKWQTTTDYVYRIVHKQNSFGSDALAEFRTYSNDQPIDNSAQNPKHLINIGFATLWLVFLPGNLHDSRFRYLGEQLVGKRMTYTLAFAQKPENIGLRAIINYNSGQCTTPLQGVAWIDQSTFQIVRIQTDLLYSLPDIQLSQLRSVLTYESVKIWGLHLSLWLPKDVETTWETTYRNVKESHRYSHYRLFKATMKVLPGF